MEKKELMTAIGERIRNGRRRKNLSQTNLAKEIGASMNGIAMIERGEVDPRVGTLAKIAEALGDDLNYIITGYRTTRVVAQMPEQELRELARAFRDEVQRRDDAEIEGGN